MKKSERRFLPISSMRQLSEKLSDNGDKVLFRFYINKQDIKTVTYNDFYQMIQKETCGFQKLGLGGKRIAVIGETSPEWIATYISVIASGSTVIPLDKELALSEVEGFLKISKADAIVYAPSFNEKLKFLISDASDAIRMIPLVPNDAEGNNILPFSNVLDAGTDPYITPVSRPEAAAMLFTSGTTGTSKCVLLSETNICSSINAACESVDFTPEDTIVSILPIHHTYELCCLLAGMNYGMEICINDSLINTIRNLKTFQPTGLVLVPMIINFMHKKIWENAQKKGIEKKLRTALTLSRSLRKVGIDLRAKLFKEIRNAFGGRIVKIISGGAPMDVDIAKDFEEFGITICEGYGITECSPLVSVNPYYALKKGSVGPAVNCCQVIIDNGTLNEKGFTEGEILVKGSNVMIGYCDNEDENKKVFTTDGYFRTGDIGYLDQDGYIFITGRKKNVIICDNGKNVYPEELEEYLSKIDLVAECVVLGRTDDAGKTSITAIVYPNDNALKENDNAYDLIKKEIQKINRSLPSFKQINALEIRETEFEKTTSKKIKRHLVK